MKWVKAQYTCFNCSSVFGCIFRIYIKRMHLFHTLWHYLQAMGKIYIDFQLTFQTDLTFIFRHEIVYFKIFPKLYNDFILKFYIFCELILNKRLSNATDLCHILNAHIFNFLTIFAVNYFHKKSLSQTFALHKIP